MPDLADAEALLNGEIPVAPLAVEASLRRYLRPLESEPGGWLLVESPDPPPVETSEWLEERGVRVPRLGKVAEGRYLVEDLGDRLLAHAPTLGAYQALWRAWEAFAHTPLPSRLGNSALALDEALFVEELAIFKTSWVMDFRGNAWAPTEEAEFDQACGDLAREAARGPGCVQHRDFHSRNVLLVEDGVALIDHQDLRQGPLFYDLASLMTDAYTPLPEGVTEFLGERFKILGRRYRLGPEEASQRLHASSLQRALKALGTFGRLLVGGRDEYAEPEARVRQLALSLLQDSPFQAISSWVNPD